jgi:hypothetical protein
MGKPKRLYFFTPERHKDPKLIIDSLIWDNISITLVDPRLFRELSIYLPDFLAEARSTNHSLIAQRIEEMIKYIEEEPIRVANAALLEKPIPQPVVKPPAFSEEEVEREVQWIWSHRQIKEYKPDELELVVAGFRQKSAGFIAEGDYLNAEKAGQYAQILISHGQLGTVEMMESERVKDLMGKLAEARKALDEDKKKWEVLYEKLRTLGREEIEKLQEDHKRAIEELEALKEKEPPPSIKKYSNRLLQLRRSEQAQLQNRNWRGAGETKAMADEMQKAEDAAQKEKWLGQIQARIIGTLKAQAKQMRVRKDHWRNQERILIATADQEVRLAETAIAHLEENLRIAQRSMNLASELKEEKEVVARQNGVPDRSALPKLRAEGEFRQRRILNAKIYTRLPRNTFSGDDNGG